MISVTSSAVSLVRSERHHFCSNVCRCRCSVSTLFYCTTFSWSTTFRTNSHSSFDYNFFAFNPCELYTQGYKRENNNKHTSIPPLSPKFRRGLLISFRQYQIILLGDRGTGVSRLPIGPLRNGAKVSNPRPINHKSDALPTAPVQCIPVQSETCGTCSRSLRQIDRK